MKQTRLLAALLSALLSAQAQADERVDRLLSEIAGDTSHLQSLTQGTARSIAGQVPPACDADDATCAGMLAGYTNLPGRLDADFVRPAASHNRYVVDENMEPGRCEIRKETVATGTDAGTSCQVDSTLHRDMVSVPWGRHIGNANQRPYMHIGPKAFFMGRPLWRYTTSTFNVQLGDIRRLELLLLGPETFVNSINGHSLRSYRPAATPVCYVGSGTECEPMTVGQLDLVQGLDLTHVLVNGTNTVELAQLWPNPDHTGALFRVVSESEDPVTDLPVCDPEPEDHCRYDTAEDRCGQAAGGVCLRSVRTLKCDSESVVRSMMACGPPVDCAGGACNAPDGDVSNASDLGNALARLETGRQVANYASEDDLGRVQVFRGQMSQCRSKVAWGLGACCRPSPQGGQTSNRQALAQLGITHALRGALTTGSPHVHDVLFDPSDLVSGLENLSVSGLASSFSPSFSFYGLEVAVSEGALSFGFDPASFAIAVAVAIVANMLECDQEERVVSMKIGAGLCDVSEEWCSSRSLFSCRERKRSYCCYNSKLARIVARQANVQLGHEFGRCEGFTLAEIEQVDFDSIDLSEFVRELSPAVDAALVERYVAESKAGALDAVSGDTPQVHIR